MTPTEIMETIKAMPITDFVEIVHALQRAWWDKGEEPFDLVRFPTSPPPSSGPGTVRVRDVSTGKERWITPTALWQGSYVED